MTFAETPMRTTFLLLTALAVWSSGEDAHREATAPVPASGEQLTDRHHAGSQAFVHVGSHLTVFLGEDASGPRGRSPSARPVGLRAKDQGAFSPGERPPSRHLAHDEHTSDLALLRAGRSSFHTATPPPFRSV